MQERDRTEQKKQELQSYQRTQMQKEIIIQKLKERKYRITKQRLLLLDIVLKEECSCCKEIFYKASKIDANIGTATVYRLIGTLEEIGAISRRNRYKIACGECCDRENACTIELDDHTVYHLSAKKWNTIITEGLKACGYMGQQKIETVIVKQCGSNETHFQREGSQ